MIFEVITVSRNKIKARGHRVLKNEFPNIELYAHYAVDDDEKSLCASQFSISHISGISIAPHSESDLFWAVEAARYILHKFGEGEVLKRLNDYAKDPLSARWV